MLWYSIVSMQSIKWYTVTELDIQTIEKMQTNLDNVVHTLDDIEKYRWFLKKLYLRYAKDKTVKGKQMMFIVTHVSWYLETIKTSYASAPDPWELITDEIVANIALYEWLILWTWIVEKEEWSDYLSWTLQLKESVVKYTNYLYKNWYDYRNITNKATLLLWVSQWYYGYYNKDSWILKEARLLLYGIPEKMRDSNKDIIKKVTLVIEEWLNLINDEIELVQWMHFSWGKDTRYPFKTRSYSLGKWKLNVSWIFHSAWFHNLKIYDAVTNKLVWNIIKDSSSWLFTSEIEISASGLYYFVLEKELDFWQLKVVYENKS